MFKVVICVLFFFSIFGKNVPFLGGSVHSLGWGRWRWWWAMMICIIAIIILKKCDTNLLNLASSFTRPMAVHWSGLSQSSANEMLRSGTKWELTLSISMSLSLSLSLSLFLSLSLERVFKQRRDGGFRIHSGVFTAHGRLPDEPRMGWAVQGQGA